MLDAAPSSKVCKGKCQRDLPLDAFGVQARGLFGRKSECRSCLSEKEAARRAADPEANREYMRQWRTAHPRTPEQKIEDSTRALTWYAKNKGRQAANLKLWMARNPEKFRAIQKKYLAKNPVHIRRAVYMGKVEKSLTPTQWAETLDYFGRACAYCLRTDLPLTMDHVTPVSKGGPHTQSNVVPACKSCNSRKGAKSLFAMLQVEPQTHTQTQTL